MAAQLVAFFHQEGLEAHVGEDRAASMPATPPPITRAALVTGKVNSCSGSKGDPGHGHRTRSLAFSRAFSGSCMVDPGVLVPDVGHIKEIVVEPGLLQGLLKGASWVRGLHEATTTRLSLFSLMAFKILSWVSAEQVNRFWSARATPGRVAT